MTVTQGTDHHHHHGDGHHGDGHHGDDVAPTDPRPYDETWTGIGSATPFGAAMGEPNRYARFLVALHERSPRWAAPAAIAACFAGAAAYVWVTDPTDAGAAEVSTCLVKLTTGLDCPGCGGTRALFYLLHANLPEAARHHAMAVFAAPFLVWLYLAWSVRQIWGKRLPAPRITARTISLYLAVWAAFVVVRNLPFGPFTALYV